METKNLKHPINGVIFNKEDLTTTLTLQRCDKENYMDTIKALLYYVGSMGNDADNMDFRYLVCNLIISMLPDEKQIINL